jgi:hypothetical protein
VKRRKGVKAEGEKEEQRKKGLKKKAGQRRRYGYTVNDATRKRCTMKTTGAKKKVEGVS